MGSSEITSNRSADTPSPAEALFFARLQASGAAAIDIEGLCAENPDLADELREVHAFFRGGLAAIEQPIGDDGATPLPTLVGDRYEVRREIESGGMGTVFEVWDHELRRVVAMKLVRGGKDSSTAAEWERRQSRLHNEAQVLGQLVHPGIIPVHEVGRTGDGDLFFTMQLVRGRHLGAIIDEAHGSASTWPMPRLIGVLLRVAEAVAYAHSRGVVHRDLKPNNIMVGPFGETYVLDWGLAKTAGARTEDHVATGRGDVVATDRGEAAAEHASPLATLAGDVLGTPAYMSPEQANGSIDQVDERADVYALGAILYHALSGRPPYIPDPEAPPIACVRAVQQGPPPPLARFAPRAPVELIAITEHAMARQASDRYESMAAIADDLRAYLENRVVRAHRTGAVVELRKWIRRNTGAAISVLAVLIGLAAVLVVQSRSNARLRARDYVNKVALAGHARQGDDIRGMQELLAACDPTVRGWEWHALDRLADTSELTLRGHAAIIECATVSPQGRWIVTGSNDTTLRLWNAKTGVHLHTWPVGAGVSSVDFHGPARILAATRSGALIELDANTLAIRRRRQITEGSGIVAARSPDGTQLALGGDHGQVAFYDSESLQLLTVLQRGLWGVSQIIWSADGQLVIVAGRDREDDGKRHSLVRVFDATTHQPVHAFPGNEKWVKGVATHGRLLASGGCDGRVRIWDLDSKEKVHELPGRWPHHVPVTFSPDGRLLLVGGSPNVEAFDTERWHPRFKLIGHGDRITSLTCFGTRLVSTGFDGLAKVWRLESPGGEQTLRDEGRALARRPGHPEFALSKMSGNIEIWNARERRLVRTTPIPCARTVVDFTPDGQQLVTGDRSGRLCLWDLDSTAARPVAANDHAHQPDGFVGLDVHPTRRQCVTSGTDAKLHLWDLASLDTPTRTLSIGSLKPWPPGAQECRFSPDGNLIAVGANDGRLRLVDTATGVVVTESRCAIDAHAYGQPAFSPDGRLVAARIFGRGTSHLAVWRVGESLPMWSVSGVDRTFRSPCFAADGDRLFTGSNTGALLVFHAQSGERYATLPGPTPQEAVTSLRFDDLVILNTERTLRFWDGSPTVR